MFRSQYSLVLLDEFVSMISLVPGLRLLRVKLLLFKPIDSVYGCAAISKLCNFLAVHAMITSRAGLATVVSPQPKRSLRSSSVRMRIKWLNMKSFVMISTTCDTQTAIYLTVAKSEDSYRKGIRYVMGMGSTHRHKP